MGDALHSATTVDNNNTWYQRLKACEAQGMSMADNNSLVLARSSGSELWDCGGKKYIDLCAGFGALVLGHLDFAQFTKQKSPDRQGQPSNLITQGMGDVYASQDKIMLLELVGSLLPFSNPRGALCVTGGQAVELAIRTAHLYTNKKGVIVFSGAYHGLDLGVLPFVSRKDFREPFAGICQEHLVKRLAYNCSYQDVLTAIKEQKSQGIGTSAILVEPVLGRGGGIKPSPGWLQSLRELASSYKALLIYDEVLTGFGRCGQLFSVEKDSSYCDIVCLGKAMGGGMPLAGCFAEKEIMDAWTEASEPIYTGTYFGHPLACRTGYYAIKTLLADSLPQRASILGKEIKIFLSNSLQDTSELKDIRAHGLFVVLEFSKPGFGLQLMQELRHQGVVLIPSGSQGNCISLTPALNIPKKLLWQALEQIICSVNKLAS